MPESLQLTVLSRLSCRRTHARARVWHLTFSMKITIEAKPTLRTGTFVTETVKQSISQLSQQSCEFASSCSCRFVSPSRFHKTGSMFIKHGIPGGITQIFRDFTSFNRRTRRTIYARVFTLVLIVIATFWSFIEKQMTRHHIQYLRNFI